MSYVEHLLNVKGGKEIRLQWIIATYIGWLILASSILLFERIELIIIFIFVGGFITAILQLFVFRGLDIRVSILNWPIMMVTGIYAGLIVIFVMAGVVAVSGLLGAILGNQILGAFGILFISVIFSVLTYILVGDIIWGFVLSLVKRLSEPNILLLESIIVIAGATSGAVFIGFFFSTLLGGGQLIVPIFLSGIVFAIMTTLVIGVLVVIPPPKLAY